LASQVLHFSALSGEPTLATRLFPSLWTNTMNRCLKTFPVAIAMAFAGLMTLVGVALPLDASAQGTVRTFPENALRGKLVVQLSPEVMLDGKPDRLSPGARIYGPDNLLILPSRLAGEPYMVNYVRDSHGLVHQVWVLTPAEVAIKRPVRSAQ
jgi:hypothetical protein